MKCVRTHHNGEVAHENLMAIIMPEVDPEAWCKETRRATGPGCRP